MIIKKEVIYPESYTMIDNNFISVMNKYEPSRVSVYLTISRLTIGWHRNFDRISCSQIKELTGLTKNTIKESLKDLILDKFIIQLKKGKYYYYSLKIDNKIDYSGKVECNKTEDEDDFEGIDLSDINDNDPDGSNTVSMVDTVEKIGSTIDPITQDVSSQFIMKNAIGSMNDPINQQIGSTIDTIDKKIGSTIDPTKEININKQHHQINIPLTSNVYQQDINDSKMLDNFDDVIIISKLQKHNISFNIIDELVAEYDHEFLNDRIDFFENKILKYKKPDNPSGYLLSLINQESYLQFIKKKDIEKEQYQQSQMSVDDVIESDAEKRLNIFLELYNFEFKKDFVITPERSETLKNLFKSHSFMPEKLIFVCKILKEQYDNPDFWNYIGYSKDKINTILDFKDLSVLDKTISYNQNFVNHNMLLFLKKFIK